MTPVAFTWPILAAVIGAALVIAAGEDRRALLSRLLSMSPFVLIGRLSYSLYLWHWPVLVMSRHTVGLSQPVTALVAFAAIALLSGLSYRYVEQPFRRSDWTMLWGVLPA